MEHELHFMLYFCLFKLTINITSVLACFYKENEKCFVSSALTNIPKVSWYSFHIFGMSFNMRGLSLAGHRAGGQKTRICIDRVRVTQQTTSESEVSDTVKVKIKLQWKHPGYWRCSGHGTSAKERYNEFHQTKVRLYGSTLQGHRDVSAQAFEVHMLPCAIDL